MPVESYVNCMICQNSKNSMAMIDIHYCWDSLSCTQLFMDKGFIVQCNVKITMTLFVLSFYKWLSHHALHLHTILVDLKKTMYEC